MAFKEIKDALLDFLFPPFCVSCDKPGAWWCDGCRATVQCLSGPICPGCLKLFPSFNEEGLGVASMNRVDALHNDHDCGGSLPFASVTSFGYYHDQKLRSAITALKFSGATVLLDDLCRFLFSRQIELPTVDAVIPMPLSEKRLRERGFNQAELIAGVISYAVRSTEYGGSDDDLYSVPRTPYLSRTGHRDPQSSLEHDIEARRANVVGAFVCRGEVPPRVLLVDDVVTTGATAGEAASVLLAAGAQEVHLLTLAIGA